MAAHPEPFFLRVDAGALGQRFALYHAPRLGIRGLVVHVHPFAEEMNKSRRMAALQARALAAEGFAVLQLDLLGCGDSAGDLRNFEQITPDIGAAINTLQQHAPQVRQVVLWGLCDGASAALLYLHERSDPRAHGLCLLNPWVRSQASLARTHVKHYYLQRLAQREFWAKLLRGQVGRGALRDLTVNVQRAASTGKQGAASAAFPERMADAWAGFDGPTLVVLSERDYTAKEFSDRVASETQWQQLMERGNVEQHRLADADHTFSSAKAKESVAQHCAAWLAQRLVRTQTAVD